MSWSVDDKMDESNLQNVSGQLDNHNQTANAIGKFQDYFKIDQPQVKLLETIKQKCNICLQMFSVAAIKFHIEQCKQNYESSIPQELQFFECNHCHAEFTKAELDSHEPQCPQKVMQCCYCLQSFVNLQIIAHQDDCLLTMQKIKEENNQNIFAFQKHSLEFVKNTCVWCNILVPGHQQAGHVRHCRENQKIVKEIQGQDLTEKQKYIVYELHRRAAIQNFHARGKLEKTMNFHGYTMQDLQLMSDYIEQKAPIIIHLKLGEVIKSLNNDCRYKNLFETNTSGGNADVNKRKKWEEFLFKQLYNDVENHERAKYGVMNYTNDLFGVKTCEGYGESVLVLKDRVRNRCTICDVRKYGRGEIVGTLKFHYAVLTEFTKQELNALYLAAKGFQIDTSDFSKFKEVQVHGPIYMFKDVQCIITTSSKREALLEDVEMFEKRFGVKVMTFKDHRDSMERMMM